MNILGIGDSIALPREGVLYEDTWFYKLKTFFPGNVWRNIFVRQMTSDMIEKKEAQVCPLYRPDVVIIQIGISDSAPRIINDRKFFWHTSIELCKKFNKTEWFWKTVKKYYTRSPKRSYVSPKKYEKNIERYCHKQIDKFKARIILLVEIAPVGFPASNRSPLWNDSISRYNGALQSVANNIPNVYYIQPYGAPDDSLFVDDGYHMNAKGHQIVTDALKNELIKILG